MLLASLSGTPQGTGKLGSKSGSISARYAEYANRGVEFTRALGDTAWHSREFVVKDCDGRLLAFGADRE